ncbi:MAG: hypothetical protein WA014_01205 [Minisyncoccia bacterium]
MDLSGGVGKGRQYEDEERLVSFFRLLLEVDRRVNPDFYTRSPVAGSDSKQEGKKEAPAV